MTNINKRDVLFLYNIKLFPRKKNPAANKLDADWFICGVGQHIFLTYNTFWKHAHFYCLSTHQEFTKLKKVSHFTAVFFKGEEMGKKV